jgi:ribosome-binding factor A
MGKHKRSDGAPTTRQLRVGESLRHALTDIFLRGELHHPQVAGTSITVSEVRPGPDLKSATVFVLPLGGRDGERLVEGLNQSAGFIRTLLGREIELKFTPSLVFKLDTSFEYASRIDSLIRGDNPDRPAKRGPTSSTSTARKSDSDDGE